MAGTIESCNNGFEIYDFTIPTSACYSFWLYDLCDVYLECLKPVFQSGTNAAKSSARQTLFTCLYNGLKLISPFMPFITEELFQRLPRADTNVLSICVSDYPELSTSPWKNDSLEKEVEFVKKAAKIIRSARSDYNIPNKNKTEASVVCQDSLSRDILKKFALDLSTTAFCSKIEFETSPPIGCAILTMEASKLMYISNDFGQITHPLQLLLFIANAYFSLLSSFIKINAKMKLCLFHWKREHSNFRRVRKVAN